MARLFRRDFSNELGKPETLSNGWVRVDGAAIFLAIEVKTDTGRATQQQIDFINFVRSHGGRAGIARSVADAERICHGDIRD